MLVVLDIRAGELDGNFLQSLENLDDGRYLVTVREITAEKTTREYQEQYFAMVDAVRDHQGDSRYVIHERFKAHQEVVTTTGFSIQEWLRFIDAFKWWAFNTLDLAL